MCVCVCVCVCVSVRACVYIYVCLSVYTNNVYNVSNNFYTTLYYIYIY